MCSEKKQIEISNLDIESRFKNTKDSYGDLIGQLYNFVLEDAQIEGVQHLGFRRNEIDYSTERQLQFSITYLMEKYNIVTNLRFNQ